MIHTHVHVHALLCPSRPPWRVRHRRAITFGVILGVILASTHPAAVAAAALIAGIVWAIHRQNMKPGEAQIAQQVHADMLRQRCVQQDALVRAGDPGGV